MEKLSAAQQQQVKKMDERTLRLKLLAAGYDEEVVLGWDRENLLSSYADVLASGKAKASFTLRTVPYGTVRYRT